MLSNFHSNYITIIRGENIAREREKHKTIKKKRQYFYLFLSSFLLYYIENTNICSEFSDNRFVLLF